MRKILALLLAVLLLFSCASCGGKDGSGNTTEAVNGDTAVDTGKTIDIQESNYVAYINEIYTNKYDYVGDTIKIEGMYKPIAASNGNTYYYVYRVGPGCCGNDGSMCGFEFTWDKIDTLKENDWIEVVGKLRVYTEIINAKKEPFITLDAISVTVKTERGAETVAA